MRRTAASGVDHGDRAAAFDFHRVVRPMKAAVSSSRPMPMAKGL
jgi:hypothetical protein